MQVPVSPLSLLACLFVFMLAPSLPPPRNPNLGLHLDPGFSSICQPSAAFRSRGALAREQRLVGLLPSWAVAGSTRGETSLRRGRAGVWSWGLTPSPTPASFTVLISPRSEQSLNHHVCSLDLSSLSRWVRVPRRPASSRAKWGWRLEPVLPLSSLRRYLSDAAAGARGQRGTW